MHSPDHSIIPLESLSRGDSAVIFDISGDNPTVHRLAEMGIRPGARITVLQAGEPMRLSVEGHDLMLRCGQSVMILVSVPPVAVA